MRPSRLLAPLLLSAIASACAGPTPQAALAPTASTPAPPLPSTSSAPPAPVPATSFVLRGRVVGHDKKPLALAHVHTEGRVTEADTNGAFTITTDATGFVPVRFTGVDHADHTVGLFFDGHDIDLEVTLGTYQRHATSMTDARAVIHVKGKDGEKPRQVARARFTPQLDGTYLSVIEAPADEMFYFLDYVARDHQVNGPAGDGFIHLGDGAYMTRLLAKGKKKVLLRLDPARLPLTGLRPSVKFSDPSSRAARLAALSAGIDDRTDEGPPKRAEHGAFRAEIGRSLAGEKDDVVLAAMRLASLLPEATLDRKSEQASSAARWLRDTLPPSAPVWAFAPEAALVAADITGRSPETDAWLDAIGSGIRHRDTAARFFAARVRSASLSARDDELGRLQGILKDRFAGTAAAQAVAAFAVSRKVRPGRDVPDFDLPLLAELGTAKTRRAHVTRASLRGKVVLIDFWGTWCVPCIKEMRGLHESFERYKARGFTILSVAKDKTASVKNFRRLQWKMPWDHVVLDNESREEALDQFEVKSYPSPILVNAEGKIIAIGDDLRGEGLRRALDVAMDGR